MVRELLAMVGVRKTVETPGVTLERDNAQGKQPSQKGDEFLVRNVWKRIMVDN
jgi:hypothetical protein